MVFTPRRGDVLAYIFIAMTVQVAGMLHQTRMTRMTIGRKTGRVLAEDAIHDSSDTIITLSGVVRWP